MYKLANNNIKVTDPNKKEYYIGIYWLKKFLPLIDSKREEIEVKHTKVFDGVHKVDNRIVYSPFVSTSNTMVKVKRFVEAIKYSADFFEDMIKQLESGNTVMVKEWEFTLVKQ